MTLREKVAQWRQEDPRLNAAEMAQRAGVSRERVRQILVALGLPTTAPGGTRREANPAPRVITGGIPVRISHTIAGTIGELLTTADLLARGYQVYVLASRHGGGVDLIATGKDGKPLRVEVRCAIRQSLGGVKIKRPDRARYDYLAMVITGEPVSYEPELPAS